ncbi:pyridoxal 5'-phosphate synthase glutaminase subunit PdxT [Oceanirhabdus sp. W0125-5]|uniref:pyridoxal 5'-phosphate synthase glutaminase subunit PdxT n=1 Tax=Oceanirhabdus sp. W0125-5 TaxID=2999116 RepID=UPI0022F31016|nr:pyridoxal 5'-phosphate synthase glutaminase subunit PdxT [Oceanirhabdus sp. W0125-5]WBW96567.1 pyridoxal 5'-phosphate synthase glutaminase subunit PdxT [Oceanirhabdus sp. W0125-5]
MKIGVLALQGAFIEHINHLKKLHCETVEVRKVEDLNNIDGIIIPGGESTTMSKLLKETGIMESIREKINQGLPVWGTCAGMIILAKENENHPIDGLKVMDIKVRRNAYGSQIDSFEEMVDIKEISQNPLSLVFIRAPYIYEHDSKVQILYKKDGKAVAAKQGNMFATAFHPELTDNLEFHRYFLSMC